MGKLLLISILAATLYIPLRFSHDRKPKRGMKNTIIYMIVFMTCWVLLCAFAYVRLL